MAVAGSVDDGCSLVPCAATIVDRVRSIRCAGWRMACSTGRVRWADASSHSLYAVNGTLLWYIRGDNGTPGGSIPECRNSSEASRPMGSSRHLVGRICLSIQRLVPKQTRRLGRRLTEARKTMRHRDPGVCRRARQSPEGDEPPPWGCPFGLSSLLDSQIDMPEVLAALDAFLQEHRRCGDLEGGVDGGRVCDCGADIVQSLMAHGPTGSQDGHTDSRRP